MMLSLSLSFAISVNCNFTNDMCYWSQSINDDFDWTFHAGSTSSAGTGPSADHTTGRTTGKLSKSCLIKTYQTAVPYEPDSEMQYILYVQKCQIPSITYGHHREKTYFVACDLQSRRSVYASIHFQKIDAECVI